MIPLKTVNIEAALEHQLEEQLRCILGDIPWLANWNMKSASARGSDAGWDFCASVPVSDGSRVQLLVECKSQLSPGEFLRVRERRVAGAGERAVLAMPRVSSRMAELCQESGWGWFDLAGNCHLEIPGALYIERTGRPPVQIENSHEANLGTPEASRVVRALLSPETAGRRWTQRDMVAHLEDLKNGRAPSLALVNKVVQSLKAQAYVEYLPDRGFRVCDPERLLKAWCAAYPHKKHLRQRYFTLLQGRALQERLTKLKPEIDGRVCYMGFSAADFQAASVRQPRTWLYVASEIDGGLGEQDLRSVLDAKRVDSGENLLVILPYEMGVFDAFEQVENRLGCTNPVQTYLDLVHLGGRGEEAAQAILEQRLLPSWKATR